MAGYLESTPTVLSSLSLNGSGATLSAGTIQGSSQALTANSSVSGFLSVTGAANFFGNSYVTAGTATAPSMTFLSEASLGFYRSGNSLAALSYGHLRAAISYSGLTASTSATTANQTVQGSFRVSVLSLTSNGAEIGFLSGNTTYKFASVAVG